MGCCPQLRCFDGIMHVL
uniref:Uncharacterized protein n=1 Tax=Anguilla anguilla TaxID=7936 RepID=A0A0E9VUR0_ANGAN